MGTECRALRTRAEATSGDASSLAPAFRGSKKICNTEHMGVLGLKTDGDFPMTSHNCTMILNGVHVCDTLPADYEKVALRDVNFSHLLEKKKRCVLIDHIPSAKGGSISEWAKFSQKIGHGTIPENYVCFDGSKTSQYLKAYAPSGKFDLLKTYLTESTSTINLE
jgi:hypothetical protein